MVGKRGKFCYRNKKIHPLDLKNCGSNRIIDILKPARLHFEKPKIKKRKQELENLLSIDKDLLF